MIKKLVLLTSLLALSNISFAQWAEKAIFKNSYFKTGLSVSYFSGLEGYNQEIWRSFVSYNYIFPIPVKKLKLDLGVGFGSRGARSFDYVTYQLNRFVDFPASILVHIGRDAYWRIGTQVSTSVFYGTFARGSRTLLRPNPHDFSPKKLNTSIITGISMPSPEFASFELTMGWSPFNFSDDDNYKINNYFVSLGLFISVGKVIDNVENYFKYPSSAESKLLNLIDKGTLFVLLRSNDLAQNYYLTKGDTAMAELYKVNTMQTNDSLIQAVNQELTCCSVVFVHGRQISNLLKGEQAFDYFGKEIDNSSLKYQAILLPGSIYQQENAISRTGYSFTTLQGEPLPYPFPKKAVYLNYRNKNLNRIFSELNNKMLEEYKRLDKKYR